MLAYTKYNATIENALGIEDLLTDVSDDMRGLYHTLIAISNEQDIIESDQIKLLGDVAGIISRAMDDLCERFVEISSGAIQIDDPVSSENE